jgi:hypothetical protein
MPVMSIFWARLSPVGSFFLGAGLLRRELLLPDDFLVVDRLFEDELAFTRVVLVFLELVLVLFFAAIAQMFLCAPSITRLWAVCSRIMLT